MDGDIGTCPSWLNSKSDSAFSFRLSSILNRLENRRWPARLFFPRHGDPFDAFREGIELAEKSGIRTFDSFLYTLAGLESLSRGNLVLPRIPS